MFVAAGIVSGLLLALAYEVRAPLESLAQLELTSPLGRANRALHASSALGLLLASLLLMRRARWLLAASTALVGLLAATGLILRGDALATFVSRSPPLGRGWLFALHVALSAPLALWGYRALWAHRPRLVHAAWALVALAALAWLWPPGLEDPLEPGGRLFRRAAGLGGSFASQRPRALWLPLAPFPKVSHVPRVLGRPEGCLGCHSAVRGLGSSHDPQVVGCSPCHLGNPFRADAAGAHDGLLLVPGNLDSVDRSCARCHADISVRVRGSPMARADGIVSVDRFAFGEQTTPDGETAITEIGSSPADTHLRQLCSSCHLGKPKLSPAPTSELSRGGGCVACHLREDTPRSDVRVDPRAFVHAGLSQNVGDESCFGCHSRSARISLTYAGFRETFDDQAAGRRALADGRSAVLVEPDVHHAKGLACIDCHTARELMGDGLRHAHEERATRVRCSTCHRTAPARSIDRSELELEAATIVRLRGPGLARHLLEDRTGEALTNAGPLAGGGVELVAKLTGVRHVAKPPALACSRQPGHERLSCQSCHASWAHRCPSCHTERDRDGNWVEFDAEPRVAPPVLGVTLRDGEERIEPFVPGMISTHNPPNPTVPKPLPRVASELFGPRTRLVRLHAFAVPHTTSQSGRSCRSCHTDPVALGYGEGTLRVSERSWLFEPKWPRSPLDGLPLDAWIGFRENLPGPSTRLGQRSLDRREQDRVLTVGACFACHRPEDEPEFYLDFGERRRKRTPACVVPE